jgi:hypothetical protein
VGSPSRHSDYDSTEVVSFFLPWGRLAGEFPYLDSHPAPEARSTLIGDTLSDSSDVHPYYGLMFAEKADFGHHSFNRNVSKERKPAIERLEVTGKKARRRKQ